MTGPARPDKQNRKARGTLDQQEWLETPEPGWKPADIAFLALEDTFVSGDPIGRRLNIRYYDVDSGKRLVGKVIFGPGTQGPPDHAHGGSMAAVLDEAMGGAAWLAGFPVVAVNLDITFRRMLPLNTPCLVEASVTRTEGRKVATAGRITSADGTQIFTVGEALFVIIDTDQISSLSPKARIVLERMKRDREP